MNGCKCIHYSQCGAAGPRDRRYRIMTQSNFISLNATCAISLLFGVFSSTGAVAAQTYDAASSFEQGFTTQQNPNGVWSYGFSSGFIAPITLYTSTAQPGVNGPNAQYWYSPSNNIGWSPTMEYNNGPAYADGNIDFLANELVAVAGIGGDYSNLLFTAPATGIYNIAASFRGAQNGIGTVVGVVVNGSTVFNSSVTALGQAVPYSTIVPLTVGNTVIFSVGPGGGLQNTGLTATVSAVPEPETYALMLGGLAILIATFRRKSASAKY